MTSSTTTTTIPGPALAPLILKDAPSGFPRKADALADTGPVDLGKAVLDDVLTAPSDARRLLVVAGFQRGYQRQWSTEDGAGQNFIYVYQFATSEGATSYLSHWSDVAVGGQTRVAPVPFTPVLP